MAVSFAPSWGDGRPVPTGAPGTRHRHVSPEVRYSKENGWEWRLPQREKTPFISRSDMSRYYEETTGISMGVDRSMGMPSRRGTVWERGGPASDRAATDRPRGSTDAASRMREAKAGMDGLLYGKPKGRTKPVKERTPRGAALANGQMVSSFRDPPKSKASAAVIAAAAKPVPGAIKAKYASITEPTPGTAAAFRVALGLPAHATDRGSGDEGKGGFWGKAFGGSKSDRFLRSGGGEADNVPLLGFNGQPGLAWLVGGAPATSSNRSSGRKKKKKQDCFASCCKCLPTNSTCVIS